MSNQYDAIINAVSDDMRDELYYAEFDDENRIIAKHDYPSLDIDGIHGTFYEAVENLRLSLSEFGVSVEDAMVNLFSSFK